MTKGELLLLRMFDDHMAQPLMTTLTSKGYEIKKSLTLASLEDTHLNF